MQRSVNVFVTQLKDNYCKAVDSFIYLWNKGKHCKTTKVHTNIATKFVL